MKPERKNGGKAEEMRVEGSEKRITPNQPRDLYYRDCPEKSWRREWRLWQGKELKGTHQMKWTL